jgi:hypothetical protein
MVIWPVTNTLAYSARASTRRKNIEAGSWVEPSIESARADFRFRLPKRKLRGGRAVGAVAVDGGRRNNFRR